MGRAINKAVTIAEILKRKLPLHQVNHTTSVAMIDSYAPTEEGLDVVSITRYVSCLMITLSLNENHVDVNDIGYQPPLSDSERTGITPFSGNRNQGSGNGRVGNSRTSGGSGSGSGGRRQAPSPLSRPASLSPHDLQYH
jgi:uncharacterized membrane protein YgcG